jgi:uncharacterized protein YjiS (DUF1127 family)
MVAGMDMKTDIDDASAEGASPVENRSRRPALRRLSVWYERWRRRRHLTELDDHILRDIGIPPGMVERERAKPFWRR